MKNGDYCYDQRTLLKITCVVRIITGITTCQHLFSVFPKYRATARKTAQILTNNPRIRAMLASLKVPWQTQRWQNHLLKLCVWLNVATRALLPPPPHTKTPPLSTSSGDGGGGPPVCTLAIHPPMHFSRTNQSSRVILPKVKPTGG